MIRRTACVLVAVLVGACIAPAAEPELHVVALYEGWGDPNIRSSVGAKVTVDRPDKEVVLIVSGHTAIEWEITATPKTKLTKVIFGGNARQRWNVLPGVETEEMSVESVKQRILPLSIQVDYDIDSGRFRNFVQTHQQYTKLEIASFQGAYRFDYKKPFVVNAVQKDERLSSDFPKLTPAAQVPKFTFEAVRIVYGKEPREARRTFGEFTPAGPAAEGFVPVPKGANRITFDTKAKRYYGIDDDGLATVDPKRGTSTKIDGPRDDNFGPPHALTFDAKRDRVIVLTSRALFEYSTKDGAWKRLANSEQNAVYAAIVWQPKTDMLLAFGTVREKGIATHVPTLFELNPDGTVANKNELGSPLFPTVLGDLGDRGDAQLIDLGRDLALLVQNQNRDRALGWHGRPQSLLYVINPKTGKVKLAWKE